MVHDYTGDVQRPVATPLPAAGQTRIGYEGVAKRSRRGAAEERKKRVPPRYPLSNLVAGGRIELPT